MPNPVDTLVMCFYLVPHIFETALLEPSTPTTTATKPTEKKIITGISEASPPTEEAAAAEASDRNMNRAPKTFKATL